MFVTDGVWWKKEEKEYVKQKTTEKQIWHSKLSTLLILSVQRLVIKLNERDKLRCTGDGTDLRRSICKPWVRLKITPVPSGIVGRDSAVGIATRYVLGRSGVESRWRRNFPHASRPVLQPTPPPLKWVSSLFRGVNMQRRRVVFTTHPHLVSRLKSRAIPLLSLWVFIACSLPLPLLYLYLYLYPNGITCTRFHHSFHMSGPKGVVKNLSTVNIKSHRW